MRRRRRAPGWLSVPVTLTTVNVMRNGTMYAVPVRDRLGPVRLVQFLIRRIEKHAIALLVGYVLKRI